MSGIKGMRWYVRRFQNPDGTLTPAGKARYQKQSGELTKEGAKRIREDIDRAYNNFNDSYYNTKNRQVSVQKYNDNDLDFINKEHDEYVKKHPDVEKKMLETDETYAVARYYRDNSDDGLNEHGRLWTARDYMHIMADPESQKRIIEYGKKAVNTFIDEYSDATLKDIGLDITPQAKEVVKTLIKYTYRDDIERVGSYETRFGENRAYEDEKPYGYKIRGMKWRVNK